VQREHRKKGAFSTDIKSSYLRNGEIDRANVAIPLSIGLARHKPYQMTQKSSTLDDVWKVTAHFAIMPSCGIVTKR